MDRRSLGESRKDNPRADQSKETEQEGTILIVDDTPTVLELTGQMVGGVVGIKKYIYDVFGDTINTAARMEGHSEPMRINVPESTYHLVADKFRFVEREAVAVKGKGKMRMYFVDC